MVACRPAPPPRLPAPGAPPPRARRQGEPREGRTAAGRERGARATGPRAGPAYSAAGAGARDGAAAAPSSPRPSAEGLVAGGGRLAGEDPGRGGLADWGPRAIKSPLLPRVWQSVPEPRHRGCVCFWTDTRTTRSTLVFSKAAPGSDVGTLWPPWAAVTLGVCLLLGLPAAFPTGMEQRYHRVTLWWLFPGGMPGFWPHHSQPSFAMCQGVCCCLWGCNCGCYLMLCVYTLGDSAMCQCLCGCDSGATMCGVSLWLAVWSP